jgi:hypothetical protein
MLGSLLNYIMQRPNREDVFGNHHAPHDAPEGDLSLRVHHCRPRGDCRHSRRYPLGCLVRLLHPCYSAPTHVSFRLKKDYPDYINVSTLLIDIVSVMGEYRACLPNDYRSPSSPVAFIPEGLPIAVTLSLAKVANTLSKHKVLCK